MHDPFPCLLIHNNGKIRWIVNKTGTNKLINISPVASKPSDQQISLSLLPMVSNEKLKNDKTGDIHNVIPSEICVYDVMQIS